MSSGTYIPYLGGFFNSLSQKADLSGATFSGSVNIPILNAATIMSGGVSLENVIINVVENTYSGSTGPSTYVQPGLNIYTGGTAELPTINISSATLVSLNTLSITGETYFSGATPLETIIRNISSIYSGNSNITTYIQPGLNIYTGGTAELPIINLSSATLANLSTSGNNAAFSFSATSLSGGTIYSGNTPLETVVRNIASAYSAGTGVHTWIQNGTNTYTGGTGLLPTINLSSITLANLSTSGSNTAFSFSATSISGGTYFSGATPLETIIRNISSTYSAGTGVHTWVQNGTNTYTGGTGLLPTINMSSATLANLSVSGNANFFSFSATSLSAGTYFSGSTPLETIVRNIASAYSAGTGVHTWVQNGTNTYTGGTGLLPTVNLSSATLNNLSTSGNNTAFSFSATSISGGTYFSGSTPLATIINNIASVYSAGTGIHTWVQNGTNTYTGGTGLLPNINLSSATLANLSVSGNANFFSFSATSVSGGTYFSGSTPLETVVRNISSVYSAGTGIHTWIQNGTNTYTGGTGLLPIVNLSSATLANLSTSGSNTAFSFSATSISGGTYFSGSTPLETTIRNISSVYSAGTGVHTWVQNGINTYTGGTGLLPTVNLSSATLNNLSTSGSNTAFSFSATSISGGTYFSGSTPLETIMRNIAAVYSGGTGTSTYIQPGTNTYTGGTGLLPTVNISALTINTLNTSGYSSFIQLSAATLSGGTIFSGNTSLEFIIGNIAASYSTTGSSSQTYIQPGINTYTGGTYARPTINVSALTINTLNVSGYSSFIQLSATSISGETIYGNGSGITSVAHTFTGITNINFGDGNLGESHFATTAVTNSNIMSDSVIIFKILTSEDHEEAIDSLVEGVYLKESDLVTGSGFTINAYADNGTWGIYDIFYKIIN